jgi:sulfur-oxidizing protein SoxX
MRYFFINSGDVTAPRPARVICLLLSALVCFIGSVSAGTDGVSEGMRLATERARGNCLACHAMGDGQLPGTIGPPLLAMKARYPEREALFRQIWDATLRNPDSRMPPFGRHGVLTREEIERIVDYLYTL